MTVTRKRCKFCQHEARDELESEIDSMSISCDDLDKREGWRSGTAAQHQRHMKNHLAPLVQKSAANIIAKKEVNEIEMLSQNVQRLDTKVNELFNQDDLGAREIDALVKLAREVRESLKYIMEFKGKLVHRRQDTIIIHQMQVVQKVLAQNHPEVWLDVKKQMQEGLQ